MGRSISSPGREVRSTDSSSALRLQLLLALASQGACNSWAPTQGDADAGAEAADVGPDLFPDFGDIPDGHVVFTLSYRRGAQSPGQIYAQEFDVSNWPQESGPPTSQRVHAWVVTPGRLLADTYLEGPTGHVCSCSACGAGCSLAWTGVVYEMLSGQGVAFEWDGIFWDRSSCADETACVQPRPAEAGRYSVEFCPSFSHWDCPPGCTDHRVGDFQCETVDFDYPQDRIVWHTLDCSAADEVGEFPSACVRTTVRLPGP
jgi:hypothetical protein